MFTPYDPAHDDSDRVGLCFTFANCSVHLGVTEEELSVLTDKHEVLGLTASDDRVYYPVWQFDTDRKTPKRFTEMYALSAGLPGAPKSVEALEWFFAVDMLEAFDSGDAASGSDMRSRIEAAFDEPDAVVEKIKVRLNQNVNGVSS